MVLKGLQDLPHVDHVLLVVPAADDNIIHPVKGGLAVSDSPVHVPLEGWPRIRQAGGYRLPSSVLDSADPLVWPHSRRQRTTLRAVLHPPPPRLLAHCLQRLVRRWLLRRWPLRRWLLRWCGLKEERMQRLVQRWLLRRWPLRRWTLRRWLLQRCGLKAKRAPPPACAAAQSRPPLSPWAGCATAAGEPPACTIQ